MKSRMFEPTRGSAILAVATFHFSTGCATASSDASTTNPDGGSSNSDSAASASAKCDEEDDTTDLEVTNLTESGRTTLMAYDVLGAAATSRGVLALARKKEANNLHILGFLSKADGFKEITRFTLGNPNLAYDTGIFAYQGKACALHHLPQDQMVMTCDDGTVEKTGILKMGRAYFPLVGADGAIALYTRSSAFAPVTRSKDGKWSEAVPKESSGPDLVDAAGDPSNPYACFISTDGKATVRDSKGMTTGDLDAKFCSIAKGPDGAIHVLTNTGYAKLDAANISAAGKNGSYTLTPVSVPSSMDFAAFSSGPKALVWRDSSLKIVEVPALTESLARPPLEADYRDHMLGGFDQDRQYVYGVTYKVKSPATVDAQGTQTVRFIKACAKSWAK